MKAIRTEIDNIDEQVRDLENPLPLVMRKTLRARVKELEQEQLRITAELAKRER